MPIADPGHAASIRRRPSPGLLLGLFLLCLGSGSTNAQWAGNNPVLELDSAYTLPNTHTSIHLTGESHLARTDHIQFSSNLTRALLGSPNIRLEMSLWHTAKRAFCVEGGLGTQTAILPVWYTDGDAGSSTGNSLYATTTPYATLGATGTWKVGSSYVTTRLSYKGNFHTRELGGEKETERVRQVLPMASLIVPLGAAGALEARAEYSFAFGNDDLAILFGSYPLQIDSWSAYAAYAHAFKHFRIKAGVMHPPIGSAVPNLRVIPMLDLWWDFLPP